MPLSTPLRRHSLRACTLALAAILAACTAFAPAAVQAQPDGRQVVDRVAAIVGDEIILKSEVDQFTAQMARQGQRQPTQDLWMNALNDLVNQKVLAEQARRDTTIQVSESQIDNQLDARIQQMTRQAGSEEKLEEIYGQSIIEIKETFRGDLRDQLLADQLRRRYVSNINITPSEVQAWFERIPQDSLPRLPETVRLSHVVRYPKPDETALKDARQVISTIRDSIVNGGAQFEEMARQFSDDPGTARDGGQLAGISLNELVPEFAAVATRTEPGDVSQVFYNDQHDGFHILRVNSKRGNTVNLNHILIRVDQSKADGSQAKEFLASVRDTLMNYDVPFELMARRHSEEEQSARDGGRVTDPNSGTRDLVLERLGPSWRRTVNQIDVGDVSEPTEVQLLNGQRAFHIVLLQRRTPAHRVNLEQDYERIREFALQDKQQRLLQDRLDDLREDVYVDVRITRDDLTAMSRF